MFDKFDEYLREQAEENRKNREEIQMNPLWQYSTSELKAELRRRKGENGRFFKNRFTD